jgi:1-acyl-sn-glycerol-3-phosphate acyltransferase
MGDAVPALGRDEEPQDYSNLRRRSITLTCFPLALALGIALSPLLFAVALLRDIFIEKRLATTRAVAFILFYLGCEFAGILGAGWIWLRSKSGTAPDATSAHYYRLQAWWAGSLLGILRHLFQLEISVQGVETLPTNRPLIILMRHSSMADTLLPSALLSATRQLRLRYVLKRELLWDPCLDVVGNRLPNVFVQRGGEQSESEIARVRALAGSMRPGDGVLVYPEGTRFSEAKRKNVLKHFREQGSSRLVFAESLRSVLPPRRGGALALLGAAPNADIVVGVHRGFEGIAGFGDLARGDFVGRSIDVEFWTIPRAEVPESDEERAVWLDELWVRVDEWVRREKYAQDCAPD